MGLAQPSCLGPRAGVHLARLGGLLPPTSGTGDSERGGRMPRRGTLGPQTHGTPPGSAPPGLPSSGGHWQPRSWFLQPGALPLHPQEPATPPPWGLGHTPSRSKGAVGLDPLPSAPRMGRGRKEPHRDSTDDAHAHGTDAPSPVGWTEAALLPEPLTLPNSVEGASAQRVPRPRVSRLPGPAVPPSRGCVCVVPAGSCTNRKVTAGGGADGQGAAAPRRDEEARPARRRKQRSERRARAWFNAPHCCLEILTIWHQRLHVFCMGPANYGADSGWVPFA